MDVLLDDVIAAGPGKVEPVSHLPLHVGHLRGLTRHPQSPLIPVDLSADQFSDGTVVDLLHRFDIALLMTTLGSGDHRQPLALGDLGGSQYLADSRPIGGDRLLHEDMLTRSHSRLEVDRSESGRRRQDHHVDTGVEQLLVGIKADEAALLGNIEAIPQPLEVVSTRVETVAEQIRHRGDLDSFGGVHAVVGGTGSSASTADQSNPFQSILDAVHHRLGDGIQRFSGDLARLGAGGSLVARGQYERNKTANGHGIGVMMSQQKPGASRREFLKGAAVASAATLLTPSLLQGKAHADGSDVIRVGLIGCGGRGSGAANNCVNSSEGVKITAMADLFRDRLDSSRNNLKGLGDRFDVPEERCFVGFDAYQQLLDSGVDMVILATPPGFRPIHFEAAVAAGKHVFMEKPVATDGPGIRKVLAAAKVAKRKGLAVVAGTQRRHQKSYIETMQQIHDGAIGELVGAQVYWNQGGLWVTRQTPQMSDMEWQVRNWLYFAWAAAITSSSSTSTTSM